MVALTHRPDRELVTPTTTAIAAASYLGAVAAIDPFRPIAIGCPIHAATGGFCPGCGSTRAVHELVHGDVVGSLVCHPLALPVVVLVTYLWVAWIVRRRGGATWALSREGRWRILVGDDAKILDELVREAPEEAYEASFSDRQRAAGGVGIEL